MYSLSATVSLFNKNLLGLYKEVKNSYAV